MKLLRSWMIAVAVGLAVSAGTARAADPPVGLPSPTALPTGTAPAIVSSVGGWNNCGHGLFGKGKCSHTPPPPTTLFHGPLPFLQKKPQLPVFQAAPWYNYWPYDGHFLTPAPINGPFYGPPMTGNFPVNPYFPGPSGFQGWGPIPGGPPPGGPMMPIPPGGGLPMPQPGGR